MADEKTQPKQPRQSHVGLYICLLVMGYFAYSLHVEQRRTTPEPQQLLPTFESRIEPLREEASAWDAGYFFRVGKWPQPQGTRLQPVAFQQQPVLDEEQQRQRQLEQILEQGRAAEDPTMRSMREANERWAAYERSQGW